MKDIGNDQIQKATMRPAGRGRPWLNRIVAGLLGALLGAAVVGGLSHAGFAPGCVGAGSGPWAWSNPDALEARRDWVRFAIERTLSKVEATDVQRAEVQSIADRLVRVVPPLREIFVANREAMLGLLARPEIDRAAMETLRSEQLDQADSISRELTTALADAAEVLTPEQRQAVVDRITRFRRP